MAETKDSIANVLSGDIFKRLGGLTFWQGTQAAYDAIPTKDSTTIYFITGV